MDEEALSPSLSPRTSCVQVQYSGVQLRNANYRERAERREVAIDLVPPALRDGFSRLEKRDKMSGAAFFGAYSMGALTTESRPGYDQYGNIWHGAFEALADVWIHLRTLHGVGNAPDATQHCPGYDVFITDEVLGRRAQWPLPGLHKWWSGREAPPEWPSGRVPPPECRRPAFTAVGYPAE